MKRLLVAIILLLAVPTPASADQNQIYLATPTNRNYEGELTNKVFESSLAPNGEIGFPVFQSNASNTGERIWIIDGALLDDVQYLIAQDSTLASSWLDRLKRAVGNSNSVYATAYGNPDVRYLQSLAPSELSFYYDYGQFRVAEILGRGVSSEKGSGLASKRANISNELRQFFNSARQEFVLLSTVIDPKEIEFERAKLGQLFNPLLDSKDRDELLSNYQSGERKFLSKLRIVSGRYQITTANQKMPITLVNEFESPAKVDLLFKPLNNRVVFPEYRGITLAPKSKIQVSVPIKTIAAGDTTVIARFENGKGKLVGATAILDLTSAIISPAVTRFTTGAGLVLILAAIAQSVRRIRKSRAS